MEGSQLYTSDAGMNAVDALAAILAKYQPVALGPKLLCATFSVKGNDGLEF